MGAKLRRFVQRSHVMGPFRGFFAAAVALVAVSIAPPPAEAGPDRHTQPLLDGCQRSDAMILTLSTPEWVYVNKAQVLAGRSSDRKSGRKTVTGIVGDIHPAGDDLFYNHDFNDVDVDVRADATDP